MVMRKQKEKKWHRQQAWLGNVVLTIKNGNVIAYATVLLATLMCIVLGSNGIKAIRHLLYKWEAHLAEHFSSASNPF